MNESKTVIPLSVSQLTNAIKLSLESTFPNILLQGEISNFKLQTSGHLYFSLKDSQAQISVVMFKANASLLKVMPKGGDQVIVKGELNVYPPKGNYQLIVRELSYVGLGELLQKLEMLKVKLHQMGWFKSSRKKPLPPFPKRIGVVTSPTGAVIQDILNILTRRFSGFHLILNPVKVQGEGAAVEIAKAIEEFNKHDLVDVMIVGRGGGSLEDLWAFNEEVVASAIYNSRIPVISAVGHETDHCIADYVADVRAPTPSAAAEIVISEKNQQLERLSTLRRRIQQMVTHQIEHNRLRLKGILKHPLFARPQHLLEWRMQKLDDARSLLDQSMRQILRLKKHQVEAKAQHIASLKPTNLIAHFRQRFKVCRQSIQNILHQRLVQDRQKLLYKRDQLENVWKGQQRARIHLLSREKKQEALDQAIVERLQLHQRKLHHMGEMLKALDPKTILNKGYAILFDAEEPVVIRSIAQLSKGQSARLVLSDGEVLVTVNQISFAKASFKKNTS